ncbi:MAG: hypothetical protein ACI9J3_001607 [Parvicellaceae bacterium]|jgi:hypothetical protein
MTKKYSQIIFTFLLLSAGASNSFGQHDTLNTDPTINHTWFQSWSGGLSTTYHYIVSEKDTMMDGNEYLIISDSIPMPFINRWAIREDTSKRIWLHSFARDTTFIACDFNLVTGDTFQFYSEQSNYSYSWTIDSVTTEFFAGSNRDFFHLTDNVGFGGYDLWIEGYGSAKGLMNGAEISSASPKILCYYQNKTFITEFPFNNGLISCDPILHVMEHNEAIYNIFPNPASELVLFEPSFTGKLVDINGREIISMKNAYSLDIRNLEAGIYFIINDTFAFKLVVQ